MSDKFTLPIIECKRCEHKWIPRVLQVRICPACKSPYWDVPRRKVKKSSK